jgi:hypothetical protein
MSTKATAKKLLGQLPFTAESYWYLRQAGKPLNKSFTLRALHEALPDWQLQASKSCQVASPRKNILIFATLHYWISHATLVGLTLAGLGHQVTLAYLPYGKWQQPLSRFDLRRQNLYARSVLRRSRPLVQPISLLDIDTQGVKLPGNLRAEVREVALRDTQYTMQVEQVSRDSGLYHLRLERDMEAAQAASVVLNHKKPEVVVIPNGTILEFGAVYRVARHLGIPTVTYEFGEQHRRIWLSRDQEVMHQQTDEMWAARGGTGLTVEEKDQVRELFAARQKANPWENFARRWQGVPSAGGDQVRLALGLDSRPIVLLATNVIGDSLTLGRQVFSDSMTEWLVRTIEYFARRSEVQLVVRIHPGELITKGPSVADVVQQALPAGIPENIHVVAADAAINTYDIVEIANLGLVYTTTVGMEMALSGVPVIVIGQTHYRQKSFTLDPNSWDAYFELLGQALTNPERYRLTQEQVERAWEYAYRFFFEYPHPFPWHLVHIWEDVQEWPIERVLGEEGETLFRQTFDYLAGERVNWKHIASRTN